MVTFFVSLLYWFVALFVHFWIIFSQWTSFLCYHSCIDHMYLKHSYDYVIVGAGTAGSIVAYRLAEDPDVSVLLIDAGRMSSSWFLKVPIVSPLLQLSPLDWQFDSAEQNSACFSLKGHSSKWPRGRVIGGTSHLNYMMYVRGHESDFEMWSKDNPGWSFQDVLPYFKKSEKQNGRYKASAHHSTAGPMIVSDIEHSTPLAGAVLEAALEMGFPIRDVNSEHQTGFMETQVHVHQGQRWSVDQGYPVTNKVNLDILCDTLIDKVLFRHNYEAYGVEGLHFSTKIEVKAKRSVILSSGTVGSPAILMRSGIGRKTHLEDLEIPVLVDLPVGKNLQDHITTGMDLVVLNRSMELHFGNIASVSSSWQYINYGKGPWTASGCEVLAIIHSKLCNPESDPPDLQIMALPMGLSSDYGSHMRESVGLKQEVWYKYFFPLIGENVASIMPVLLHPKSRGEILLRSKDPNLSPIINPNYLSEGVDVEVLYEGIQLVKEIVNSKAMQKLGAHIYNKSLPGCESKLFDSVEYWECYIRHLTLTSYHPVGTCKMGPSSDSSSVIDTNLKVHRTNKLFVIDASIMPIIPSGNINAAIMMIAEKGADLVKKFWHQTTRKCHPKYFYTQLWDEI